MAYGVDRYPDPPEAREGHIEWDRDDDDQPLRRYVQDLDEDGAPLEEDS